VPTASGEAIATTTATAARARRLQVVMDREHLARGREACASTARTATIATPTVSQRTDARRPSQIRTLPTTPTPPDQAAVSR